MIQADHGGALAHYDYGFRIYNPAVGRFLSVDPLASEYPYYTPYQFAGNTPIKFIDLDGLEPTSNPGDANKLIDDNRGTLENRHGIKANDFLNNLSTNINDSENIHQGKGTNFCGPACLTSQTFVKNDPVGYVNLMLNFYNNGSATYNNGNEDIELTIGKSSLANLNSITNEGLAGNPADKILLMSLAETFSNSLNVFGGQFNPGDQEGLYASTTFDKFLNMTNAFGYNFDAIGGNTIFGRPNKGEAQKFATENIGGSTVVLFVNGPLLRKTDDSALIGTHYIALKTIHSTQDLVKIQYWDYGANSDSYKNAEFTTDEFNDLVFGAVSIKNPE